MASRAVSPVRPDSTGAGGNLRTCGRQAPPLWQASHKPKRIEATDANKQPTIPSRFEVTLFKGDREKTGFGSNSLRFIPAPLICEVPGPGNYPLQPAFHEDFQNTPSWGIRGTGGFASRSRRFGSRSMPTMPIMNRGGPGAGAYEPMDAMKAIKNRKDFTQAKTTSAFAAQADCSKNAKMHMDAARAVPGPAHYPRASDQRVAISAAHVAAAKAAFRSLSDRAKELPGSAPEEVPGPGEYSVEKQRATSSGPGEKAITAVFRSPSRPRIVQVHRDLPAADQKAREALGEFADVTSRECQGMAKRYPVPGPGHYDQDRDAMWDGCLVAAGGSSFFQPGPQRSGPCAKMSLAPGPGRYEEPAYSNDKLTSAKSAFVSTTERNKLPLREAPGPAYYTVKNPKLVAKKSFMLNVAREWVA